MVVAQHLLEGTHIHAVLEHQGGRRVAQLVGGVLGAVQAGGGQVLLHQLVNRRPRDAPPVLQGHKEGVLVHQGEHAPLGEPVLQRALTGLVEKEHPLLVALAQHPQLIATHVGDVQPHQLRDPQAAV